MALGDSDSGAVLMSISGCDFWEETNRPAGARGAGPAAGGRRDQDTLTYFWWRKGTAEDQARVAWLLLERDSQGARRIAIRPPVLRSADSGSKVPDHLRVR